MRIARLGPWTLLVALLASSRAHADALRKVDQAAAGQRGPSQSEHVRSEPSTSRTSSRPRRSSFHDPALAGNNNPCASLPNGRCKTGRPALRFLVDYTVGGPWTAPRLFDDPRLSGYARYPFADGTGLLREIEAYTYEDAPPLVRYAALALDLESGYLLEGVVPATLGLRLALRRRIELDARASLLSDVRESPTQRGAHGSAHLGYRFAQGSRFDFRTGLGMRLFTVGTLRLGFDFLYAVDAYLADRVVLRVELHVGNLAKAFVGEARSTLGIMQGRIELYAGYDHTSFLGEGGTARLGGPIAGLRAWF